MDTGSADSLVAGDEARFAPPALARAWQRQKGAFARGAGVTAERAARYRALRRLLIRRLHAVGVPIAVGSDGFGLFDVPGFGTLREMEILAEAGLPAAAVLDAATRQVARLADPDGAGGTVALGGPADLVLLDADPLASIANVRRQAGVMLRGAWLPAAEVRRRLDALRDREP